MAIAKQKGLVLQSRDRQLLQEIAILRVVDREQAKMIAGFGSTTRVNTRLLALHRAGFLKRFFLGSKGAGQKALYGISRQGALLVDRPYRGLQRKNDEALPADFFVQHQLLVNDLYCSLNYRQLPLEGVRLKRWLHFFKPITPEIRLIPDGYVEFATGARTLACFLEIDRGVESLKIWSEKARNYLQLARTRAVERLFGIASFDVLVIANSERRIQSIRSSVRAETSAIFWFAALADVQGPRFFGPVWLRPKGEERVQLIDPRP